MGEFPNCGGMGKFWELKKMYSDEKHTNIPANVEFVPYNPAVHSEKHGREYTINFR
jgi:hypothetical protein